MWNKFLYRLCCLILGLVFSVQGLADTYTPTWDELRQGLSEGKQECFNYLFQLKSHFEQIEEWDESIKGTYQSAIQLLSDFASKQGLYDFQEELLLNALNSFQKRDSSNNSFSRDVLVSMTVLYNSKKDYDKVLKYGIEAINKFQTAHDFGLGYITLMHNLSNGAIAVNDCESAFHFVQEGIQKLSSLDMQHSTEYNRLLCHLLNDCGRIAYRQGYSSLAEECYLKCIDNALNNDFASLVRLARNNLAVLYIKLDKFDQAVKILEECNKEQPSCESLLNLLHLRYRLHAKEDSSVNKNLTQYNNLRYSQSIHVINSSGEFERMAFLEAITKEMIWNNNLIASHFPETTEEAFDANLFGRNISIGVNVALRNIVCHQDTETKELLANLRNQLFSKDISHEETESTYEQIAQLEKHLLSSSNTALNDEIAYVGSWDVIKESLLADDVVLLFCYIPTIDNTNSDYGVYIGSREMESPLLISLYNADDLEDTILNISNDPISISEFYQNTSGQIIDKIWDKILPYIKGKNRIFYTPIGVLSLINMEAVNLKNGVGVDECFEFIMCSSPTRIIDICNRDVTISNISFFGAPNFNLGISEMEDLSEKFKNYSGIEINDNLNLLDMDFRSGWGELPGTVYEISTLSSLTSEASIKTLSYIGDEATEEQFKALSGSSPDIIHVASHGFSYSQTNENDNSETDVTHSLDEIYSVLQLSGLVLTGGNNVWQGKVIPDGVEDGILTAEEIARLDLSNTDLVVLSACDTGLGMMDPVDGVWGLQRAFKQAGVGSVLMTLWKIPDTTTTMFMTEFYSQLLSGRSKHQSLKNAQNYLIENGASNPYYWASFVLLDAI